MAIYVVSRSGNKNFALYTDSVVEIVSGGLNPLGDARQYAHDHTSATGEPAFVYEVELVHRGSYKTEKAVVFVPAK